MTDPFRPNQGLYKYVVSIADGLRDGSLLRPPVTQASPGVIQIWPFQGDEKSEGGSVPSELLASSSS